MTRTEQPVATKTSSGLAAPYEQQRCAEMVDETMRTLTVPGAGYMVRDVDPARARRSIEKAVRKHGLATVEHRLNAFKAAEKIAARRQAAGLSYRHNSNWHKLLRRALGI